MSACRFVIDGTNVLLLHGRANPELRYVLALCSYLRERDEPFICYFDANTPYVLKDYAEDQARIFDQVTADAGWSASLVLVPSGTEADEWIIGRAKTDGADVLSNDKYRKRARRNPWIWKRRHSLLGTRDRLVIETLGVEIPVLPAAENYL